MPDDTRQTREVKAKRTAKNSIFLDLFQDKKNLLELYKALHPEDAGATEDKLDIVTLEKIARYVPALSMEELKELETEVIFLHIFWAIFISFQYVCNFFF